MSAVDKVLKVTQASQVIKTTGGTPSSVRVERTEVKIIKAGMPGRDGRNMDELPTDITLIYNIAKL